MRFIFLLLVLALNFGQSNGQKLHAFLFCNTSDAEIGISAGINFIDMRDRLQLIADALSIPYKEYPITGSAFEMSKVSRELATAQITSDDIVVLYFSTHGGKTTTDKSIFPHLIIPDSLVSAYAHHRTLLQKKPKIILTMIEACSGYVSLTSQQAFVFEQNIPSTRDKPLTVRQKNNIKKLFGTPFKLIITAGEPGKNTYATNQGSIFTKCFLNALSESIDLPSYRAATDLNWNNILEQTKTYTINRTSNLPINYYPVWETTEFVGLQEQGIVNYKPSQARNIIFNVKTKKKKIPFGNPYIVTLSVKNKSIIKIDSVVYYLHETMPRPVVKATDHSNDYSHTFSVWGEFPVKAKVYFSDGKNFEYYKNFELTVGK